MLECRLEEQEKAQMDFVEKLKSLRKESGLTQQEVADKLFVSRSLYAKYESGLATPSKDTLQKMALLFNTGVNELISTEETTFMLVEEQQTRQTLKNLTLVSSSVICAGFIIFYFIPLFQAHYYDYNHLDPITGHPTFVTRLMSSFAILDKNSNPIGNITLAFVIAELILSILCLTIFNKKQIVARYITYVLFAVVTFMIFITIAFSCSFAS
jgi:transcriptional regulator with XRE-family HTH domain